jgi:transcriptional regulator with XRE-family HTH domain
MKQKDFAALIGISNSYLSEIISKGAIPSKDKLFKMMAITQTDVWFWYIASPPEKKNAIKRVKPNSSSSDATVSGAMIG